MNFFSFFIAACFCTILFTSCQKEINEPSPESSSQFFKVKSYTETTSNGSTSVTDTFNFTYYSDDKLKTVESNSSLGDKVTYSYTYSPNQFHMDLFYDNNTRSIHVNHYLNDFFRIDSTLQYNNAHDTTTEKYIYNSAKQLTTLNKYAYKKATGAILLDTDTYLYDAEGNIIKEENKFKVTTYEYYPDLKNTYFGLTPYTNQSPKLVKTTTSISGSVKTVLNHSYTFDSQNRLTSETITEPTMGITTVKLYSYF